MAEVEYGIPRVKGIVKWFSEVRGYGYIKGVAPEEYAEHDFWAHYTAIVSDDKFKSLKILDEVEFTPCRNDKGIYARDIVLLNRAPKGKRLMAQESNNLE